MTDTYKEDFQELKQAVRELTNDITYKLDNDNTLTDIQKLVLIASDSGYRKVLSLIGLIDLRRLREETIFSN